jgi:hypothetical protein
MSNSVSHWQNILSRFERIGASLLGSVEHASGSRRTAPVLDLRDHIVAGVEEGRRDQLALGRVDVVAGAASSAEIPGPRPSLRP